MLIAAADRLTVRNTPSLRALRRQFSREWSDRPPTFIYDVAQRLAEHDCYRWLGAELIRFHPHAFRSVDDALLEVLAAGLDSWGDVDAFGRILAGPAWASGLASDALIKAWAGAPDRWLRRLALVATVGLADSTRVLAICTRLSGDPDDMVVKAMSWALRDLSKHDPDAVRRFLRTHDGHLAARVKREVGNKLTTGLKNPRKT